VQATLLLAQLPPGVQSLTEAEAEAAAATAELADQSWLRGMTIITASAGVATFMDLAVSRANSYPPGYPEPAAGARGAFLIQFTVRNLVAVAGARPTISAPAQHTIAADLECSIPQSCHNLCCARAGPITSLCARPELTAVLALPGPITVIPGPWAGLHVRRQPGAGRAGLAMRFQPVVALVDAYLNDLYPSAVPAGGIAVNASLLPDTAPATAATLYRLGCDAACSARGGGLPRVCSGALRLSGPAAACRNAAVAAAGLPAVFTDLAVERVGVFRMLFETAAPGSRSTHSAPDGILLKSSAVALLKS
jgi:hypothetical protein